MALAAATLAMSLWATVSAWTIAREETERSGNAEFDFQVRQTVRRIEQRMSTYEQAQRSTQAFLLGSMKVSTADFRLFVATLRLQENYPGIQGIALVELIEPQQLAQHEAAMRSQGRPDYAVKPEGPRPVYSSIIQIEPFTGLNLRALGFDMLSEPNRRAAMERARDTGAAAASGKVRLIQEHGADVQAGLVMYLPVYRRGQLSATVAQRRANLLGWVGAPFRMNDLMAGLGGERSGDVEVSIYDGNTAEPAALLYGSQQGARNPARVAKFGAVRHLVIAGRPWTLEIRSAQALERRIETGRAGAIAVVGGALSVVLALLVWLLASGRGRAIALASQMTQQLRESEFRWKYALEGAGDGVWDWNSATGHVVYSKRWKAMLGYADDDITPAATEWDRLLHPEDAAHAHAAMARYLASTDAPLKAEFRMRCKDGSWKWILTRGMAVQRKPDGTPLRTIGTHTDISDRKQAEQLDAERLRALDEARAALHHAQKLEAVGQLTGGVAHDFNNVLQVVSGNVQLLQKMKGDAAFLQQRLSSIENAVRRGARLASQLLAFARRQPLQPAVVNLSRLLAGMQELLERALGDSAQLRIVAPPDLWSIFVDPGQLENVILNLAINARHAMGEGGALTVDVANVEIGPAGAPPAAPASTLAPGQYVRLAIADTGGGMTPEVMRQAFEPFFTTKPVGQGTGLGLSMAYGFVTQSGGQIHLDSVPGQGTTVTIYLARSNAPDPGQAPAPHLVERGGTETLLVVEDDEDVRVSVVANLIDLGYTVLEAADGQQALAMLQGGVHVDLLFTDVVMPGELSGPELAATAARLHPRMAVLFTSGYTRDALSTDGRLREGVQLLGKPYGREQLAQRIRALLDAQR